jgi:hypothetical protein
MAIALEGEDAGDAPWAAANTIADFPADMLLPHKASLEKLAAEQWTYLHVPGRRALEKIRDSGGTFMIQKRGRRAAQCARIKKGDASVAPTNRLNPFLTPSVP